MKKKFALMAASLVLVAALAVGGTLAWLTDKTDSITNTFTVGNVDISLAETTSTYKMVPGNPIDKDPKVTVKAGSEACWVFVKIEESTNLDDFISYTVDSGWTALGDTYPGVYYRAQIAISGSDNAVYSVLANNQVTVNNTVTKQMMDALTDTTRPTLKFTAYAVQSDGFSTAAAAWEATFGATTTTP